MIKVTGIEISNEEYLKDIENFLDPKLAKNIEIELNNNGKIVKIKTDDKGKPFIVK